LRQQRLGRSALINLLSRLGLGVFGLLQVILIAREYGVSATTDAYMISVWITLIIWGMGDTVLTYSLVPYLVSKHVKEGRERAVEAANHIFTWFFLSLLVLAVVLYLVAPYLVALLAPGFSTEAYLLAVDLLRLLSPVVFIGGLAAFLAALSYTLQRFGVPALAAQLPDLGAISFILFGGIGRWGIKAVVAGFLSGVALQLIVLFFALLKAGVLPRFRFSGIREFINVARLMGPRAGGIGVNRGIIGIDRLFASMLGAGSVSVLGYTYRLTLLPVSLAVATFGKTLMPHLSKEVAEGNMDYLRKFVPYAIRFVLFGLAPLVLIFVYFSETIIRLLYQRGNFTGDAAVLASGVFIFYSLAILFSATSVILSGIFFASGDTWTPFKVTFLALILNALLDFLLMNIFGIIGIPMATLGVSVFTTLLLYMKLNAGIGGIEISHIFGSILKIGVATLFMGVSIMLMKGILARYLNLQNTPVQLIEIALISFVSWVFFLVVCRCLKLDEYRRVESIVGRKLGWVK